MTCGDIQQNLSFYLYGELDFSAEEAIDEHLAQCAGCRGVLAREQQWHEAVQTSKVPVPLDLLSQCREELRDSIGIAREAKVPLWIRCLDSLGFRSNAWSMRIAMASFLVCLGFGISRLVEQHGFIGPNVADVSAAEMGLFDPSHARVRLIEPGSDDQVQLVVDEVREHIITGSRNDPGVRQLLLTASKDPTDPAIRVDSVAILKDTEGEDVQEALLDTVEHDPNAGVRLKAMDALNHFTNDSSTRRRLVSVLSHDDNPDVRIQAIDLLVPPQGNGSLSPQLMDVLANMMQHDPDEYIRMRCQQALQSPHTTVHVY